jgi:hypothetical protein
MPINILNRRSRVVYSQSLAFYPGKALPKTCTRRALILLRLEEENLLQGATHLVEGFCLKFPRQMQLPGGNCTNLRSERLQRDIPS